MASPNPCDASLLSQIWEGNAILCSDTFKTLETKSATDQIQSVADNAANYYGDDSQAAQVAQQTALAQESFVPTDVTGAVQTIGNSSAGKILNGTCSDGSPGVDLTLLGAGCVPYSTLKEIAFGLALALGAGFLLYATSIAAPFLPRRR